MNQMKGCNVSELIMHMWDVSMSSIDCDYGSSAQFIMPDTLQYQVSSNLPIAVPPRTQ